MPAPRGPRLVLEQMLEAVLDIERFTTGQTFDDYVADRRNRRAVERSIEIVSEASRRLPAALKARHPAIPWPKVAGSGNVLRHDYDVVNDATIWHAAIADLLPSRLPRRRHNARPRRGRDRVTVSNAESVCWTAGLTSKPVLSQADTT